MPSVWGKSSESVQSTCWRPVTHAQTWASCSAVYRFGSLSVSDNSKNDCNITCMPIVYCLNKTLRIQDSTDPSLNISCTFYYIPRPVKGDISRLFGYTDPRHFSTNAKMYRLHIGTSGQIFRIGTVRHAEGLWHMRRYGPVIAHCTDSEDFPTSVVCKTLRHQWRPVWTYWH